ncbi:hypothetical protein Q5Y75_23725 [Ruegeria sp. 2205SS24-7]|uniref:hypothetical protein n=1 Tax=Ruegeria discodermiae TaxID=3064389 RepID=UPI00274172C0|nr:hypothetical protein [Ruegeria sp. 2205SS24-7]MDP5220205.1 hypothetical protein [Ruegeria sp. 2205SS24-7]
MSVGKFAFLPNLRSGAAADADLAGIRQRLSYDLEILGNGSVQGSAVPVSSDLMGPGDVIGLDPGQIMRVEPEDANKGFEPNYFPFVQLKDADLPWRYTLDSGAVNRLTPWLVAIVLKRDEFSYLDQGSALCPRIEVASAEASLPNLAHAWATAHVQVDMDGVSGTPGEVLHNDSGRGFSRLFACRKLEQSTAYTLFLVPSYKVGLDAALGAEPDPGDGAALAWNHASGNAVILSYYYRHTFKTEGGQDLEALLRKLRAIRADEADEAGAPLWVSGENVGYYEGLVSAGYIFPAQAALRQPDAVVPKTDTPDNLEDRMVATLATVLTDRDGDVDGKGEDPLLTFPAYGARYAAAEEVSKQRARLGFWFDRVNLDLKFRAAAGLGHDIVRANDEHFAQLCWEQYDEILAANQALQQLQVASILARRLDAKHFSRLASETAVQLSQPLTAFVRVDPSDDTAPSVRMRFEQMRLPEGFTSLSLRRTLSRKPQRSDGGGRVVPMAALPGDETPSASAKPREDGALWRREQRLAEGGARGEVAKAMEGIFNPETLGQKPRPQVPGAVVGSYASAEMAKLVGDKLVALPRQKADHLIAGRTATEEEVGGIIWRTPRVPEPLIDYLMRISRDGVLSNAAALPENTVSFYEENRHFVEALMVGANHAMNEELRWREYPTDMRGTVFSRFWNRGAAPEDSGMDDIIEIREWTKKLGTHSNPADADGKANLVAVIKGEVVRKLKDPLVVISIAAGDEWDPNTAEDHDPVFFGKIGRDCVYYGFDVSRDFITSDPIRDRAYFAIYEPPARLRFGLDVGNTGIRASRPLVPDEVLAMETPPALETWDDLSWAHMRITDADYVDFSKRLTKPAQETKNYWNQNKQSAGLARSFWQKPLAALLPLGRVL